jgi:epoxyqueuosine reductase
MAERKDIAHTIKTRAYELGFSGCALLPVSSLDEEQIHFEFWLAQGMHGEMGYMVRNKDKRLNPALLVKGAKTILVVLHNYYPEKMQSQANAPVLSKYAYGTDYHIVLKEKLRKLLAFIHREITPCHGRVFVDSAPVLERAWARRAGLGWIGKNSNLITVEHGSFVFIGELIVDAELPYDHPEVVADHCGTCTRCIDACPTKAITAGRMVDARKCISYQTIEVKGNLDPSLKGKFENRVFGCDICQDVCPWNRKLTPHREPAFKPNPELLSLKKEEWHTLTRTRFDELFRNSPVQRTGFTRLKRNLLFMNDSSAE